MLNKYSIILLLLLISNIFSQSRILRNEFDFRSAMPQNMVSIQTDHNYITKLNLCVILIYFNDNDTLFADSKEVIKNRFFSTDGGIYKWYDECSYGKVKPTGDVFGWYKLNRNAQSGNLGYYDLIDFIESTKIDISKYDQVVLIYNLIGSNYPEPMGWAGVTTFNGKVFCVSHNNIYEGYLSNNFREYDILSSIIIHEIGHGFGFHHAGQYQLTNNLYSQTERENFYDKMGGGDGHFNPYFKEYIGWLDSSACVLIKSSGNYELKNYRSRNGKRYAKINYDDEVNHFLYLEFRDGLGIDSLWHYITDGNTAWNNNGLLITSRYDYWSIYDYNYLWQNGAGHNYIVDVVNNSRSKYALKENNVFIDSTYGIKISDVIKINDSTLTFNVSFFGNPLTKIKNISPIDKDTYYSNIIKFEWGNNDKAISYELMCAGKIFNNISANDTSVNIYDINTPEFYKINDLIEWNVRYKTANGKYSPWSLPYSLILEITPTSVSQENSIIPAEYFLSDNFPNPFNPTTKISYSIPKASFVNLSVYDIIGRKIATLVNEEKPLGKYEIIFNGNNLSSGIYFYSLKTNDFIKTKKFILMK